MNPSSTSQNRSSCAVPLGFAYIYVAWGCTFLGVKFAIVDVPVFIVSGARFFLAGLLLISGIALFDRAGFRLGTLREWKDASTVGLLLLVLGIGTGNWTQQYVDSSFAAMVFSGMPLWIILIDWLRPGGAAPSRTVAVGLLLGFMGIGVILAPTGHGTTHPVSFEIDLLLVLASIFWAAGAVLSRHVHASGSALLPVARQMIVAGMILLLAGCLHGDLGRVHLTAVHLPAWLGFAFLVVIGSLGGYPIYIWLMRACPPAKAATVPYANLLVAMVVGWAIGHEVITPRLLIGSAIVIVSVAVVLRTKAPDAISPAD